MECGVCACIGYEDIDAGGYCVARDEDLVRFNCDTSQLPCSELSGWRTQLEELQLLSADDQTTTGITSYAARTIDCEDKLDQALIERCGAPPKCDCSGSDCRIALSDFHPLAATLGDARTGYNRNAIRETCPPPDGGDGRYSECSDGTVRYEVTLPNQNKYQWVFSSGSEQLSYGHADGYVGDLCGISGNFKVIDTGPAPAATTCRTCAFCEIAWDRAGEGGAGGGGAGGSLPQCVFDSAGKISLPPP